MKGLVKGKVNSRYGDIMVQLDVIQYDEDGCRMVYCPALDVIGYGRSDEEAETSFITTLQEFLDYTLEHGTLRKVLKGLGWKFAEDKVTPPVLSYLIPRNDMLREIVDGDSYVKSSSEIRIPSFV